MTSMRPHASVVQTNHGSLDVEPSFPRSRAEQMMIRILRVTTNLVSLAQIAKEIELSDPTILTGKTPRSSLYSIVYRREKRREDAGLKRLFKQQVIHREIHFTLNSQHNQFTNA